MSMNIYVGNLPYSTTEADLRDAFSEFGSVERVQIIMDRETGRSRGFAFVEMMEGGSEAVTQLNGADFQGRRLTVNEARPRETRARSYSAGYQY